MGLDNPSHIAILVVILLLVFGARRLPEIGRSLGSGLREFKGAITGEGEKPPAGTSPEPPAASQTRSASGVAAGSSSAQGASGVQGASADPATGADAAAPAPVQQADHAGTPTA
jgi:TatA/E family protein of Tat protein translocase